MFSPLLEIRCSSSTLAGTDHSRGAIRAKIQCAFEHAIHQRRPAAGLVHHSDRGSHYLSIKYTERLAEAGIEPSVGSVGVSNDSALAETIKSLFKAEVIHRRGNGAASTPWNMPHSNGLTGSTTAACWDPSATSRQQRPKQTATQIWKLQKWPRSLYQPAFDKPGVVQAERSR